MALLDSGCTKTVCGKTQFQHYFQSLLYDGYKHTEKFSSSNLFKFGDSEMVKDSRLNKIPVIIAEISAALITDAVKYDIPLLLRKKVMKKAKDTLISNNMKFQYLEKKN